MPLLTGNELCEESVQSEINTVTAFEPRELK